MSKRKELRMKSDRKGNVSRSGRPLWIIKAGSQMVCEGGPLLLRDWMRQVADLTQTTDVVWVTSGAIATARDRMRIHSKDRTLPEKQALSAIGQPMVMDQYQLALAAKGLVAAQILLTSDDLKNAERRQNFMNSVSQLLSWGAVPILNENDAVSTQEIQFGDNDQLSAQVAKVLDADRLVILTDVAGLFDSDPKKNPKAVRIPHLEKVTDAWMKKAGGAEGGSARGTGGMYSKLKAAQIAQEAGLLTHLVQGDEARVLLRLHQMKIESVSDSKTWIGTTIGSLSPKRIRGKTA